MGQRAIRHAYERLLERAWTISGDGSAELAGLRDLVRDSWHRSLAHLPDPERTQAPVVWSDEEVRRYRERHPLAAVLPVVQRLLVEPSADTGVVVAVGDEHGRLLWVDGDRATLARTDQMSLRPGADWSENAMGTSAPGTALVVGSGVQIARAEHFVPAVQGWSCTAVPVHDPSGRLLGVIDVTGGDDAVGPRTLAWVQAAAGAVEAELRLLGQRSAVAAGEDGDPAVAPRRSLFAPGGLADGHAERGVARETLAILGRRGGLVRRGERRAELSTRHAEILTLLAVHPAGLSLDGLAQLLDPQLSAITLRAEVSRLRRVLEDAGLGDLSPLSRPYRLPRPVAVDAEEVHRLVGRGDLDRALREYPGAVLPESSAPGIARLRAKVSAGLREAVLGDGSLPTVLAYLELPEVQDDVEAWTCALRMLPATSPRRALLVTHLERLELELR